METCLREFKQDEVAEAPTLSDILSIRDRSNLAPTMMQTGEGRRDSPTKQSILVSGLYPIAKRAFGDLRDVTAGDQRLGNLSQGKCSDRAPYYDGKRPARGPCTTRNCQLRASKHREWSPRAWPDYVGPRYSLHCSKCVRTA